MKSSRMKRGLLSLALLILLPATFFVNAQAGSAIPRPPASPWMVYVGGFGGYYSADYGYNTIYTGVRGTVGRNAFFNHDLFQQGVSGGGQIGVQYHLRSPYYFGLVFSAAANAEKARYSTVFQAAVAPVNPTVSSAILNLRLQIDHVLDMAAVIGMDITPRAHLYMKAGGAYAEVTGNVVTNLATVARVPSSVFQSTAVESLWGVLVGLGLTYDLNKWLSAFTEYDYTYYGSQDLGSFHKIWAPFNTTFNTLAQHATISTSSLRVGLNLKFMDAAPIYRLYRKAQQASPWSVYLGGFSGVYSSDFGLSGLVIQSTNVRAFQFDDDTFQRGGSVGGQIGIQYHPQRPYYFGLVFSAMGNTGKSKLTRRPSRVVTPQFEVDINNELQITSNFDLAGLFGMDLTPRTHFYVKFGGSRARMKNLLYTTQVVPTPTNIYSDTQRTSMWGWVLGAGLTYDINSWLSAFGEYDYYSYDPANLNAANALYSVQLSSLDDRHVRVASFSTRLGLNMKLLGKVSDALLARRHLTQPAHWTILAGIFGGYYNADFLYSGNYVSPGPVNVVGRLNNNHYNNDTFQQGISGGGQVGVTYHLRDPYYFGVLFSAMANSNRAQLANEIRNTYTPGTLGFNFNNEFSITNSYDLAALAGVDITRQTHAYVKIGASDACLKNRFFSTDQIGEATPAILQRIQDKNVWGGFLGLGLSHDLTKWLDIFAEYDFYDYGSEKIGDFTDVTGAPTGTPVDRMIQHVSVTVNSARIGLDAKFNI